MKSWAALYLPAIKLCNASTYPSKRYFSIRSPSKTYSIATKPDILTTPSVIFNKHRFFFIRKYFKKFAGNGFPTPYEM